MNFDWNNIMLWHRLPCQQMLLILLSRLPRQQMLQLATTIQTEAAEVQTPEEEDAGVEEPARLTTKGTTLQTTTMGLELCARCVKNQAILLLFVFIDLIIPSKETLIVLLQ